ncbi:MAG: lipopolysaccharide core heptose(I) kinase RfaP [Opitutales bacterium]
MHIAIAEDLRQRLPEESTTFDRLLMGEGTIHRQIKNRLTYETWIGDRHVFVKRQLGCGWKTVLKEWSRFRQPTVSARTEWEAAERLAAAGIPVPRILGKGERGTWPHAIESFVILEALENCETLEYFHEGWLGFRGAAWVALKQELIGKVASIARCMHQSGMNHRDFYLTHFLIARSELENWSPGSPIHPRLIDLHRVQRRTPLPARRQIKDLGALLFSALDSGLTSADCGRFLRVYLGSHWKEQIRARPGFWKKINRRAIRLYADFHGKSPALPAFLKAS